MFARELLHFYFFGKISVLFNEEIIMISTDEFGATEYVHAEE